MNILMTGNLSSMTTSIVDEFVKRKHHLVLVSEDADKLGIRSSKIIVHAANPADLIYRDVVSSYGFDIVIYLATREEQFFDENHFTSGQQLDGLRNTLELSRSEKLKHFFYLSSTEVYGDAIDPAEEADPQPSSINGHTLRTGENICRIYHDRHDVNITIVRLPHIYGIDERSGLVYRLITACIQNEQASFPASENTEISLLHALDVTDFLIRAMDEEYTPEALVINLPSTDRIKFHALALLLQKEFPKAKCSFMEGEDIYTKPVKGTAARRIYDWIDTHTFGNELQSLAEHFRVRSKPERSSLEQISGRFSNYPELLKWIELIGGTLLIQFLSQITGTLIQFKYVDFRLLFVVIMGSIYGIRTGLYAAALVSLSILYTWSQLGFDGALLVYNVGNWLPFALYFTAGLITGYYHDKTENHILNTEKQTRLIREKYSFLYEVFNDIRNLKDEFRERLLGYRDSFGKIYSITKELDQLQEDAIFLRALSILEEHMDNRNIAIYSVVGDGMQARLEANSMSMNGKLSKSINLSNFPEMLPYIKTGTIFQNTTLLPNYPSYLVPIFNSECPDNGPAAMIAIWSVKFEQYSTYYHNHLKVICGLIQASLVRAALFSIANYERMYLPSTRILNHEAFIDTLKVRMEMRKNRISDFQLVVMENLNGSIQEAYPSISEGIRNRDVIGMGREDDYYILLSQADKVAAQEIVERLTKLGIHSRIVDTQQILTD